MSSPTHIVFGTNAAFSHVPSFTKLAKALVVHSSEVVISIILHVNNVENVEKIISDLPADARARIKTFSVGEILPWKEVPSKGMMSLLWESGKAYGAVLAGTEWPAPSVVVFDVTAFFYPAVFSAVSSHFPHVKASKVVAYSPVSISEVIHLIGEDRHGGLQWMAEELTKRDVPFASSEAYSSTEARSLESFLPPPDVLQKQIAAYMEVAIMNDRVINVPGCPPFHVYEKWSTEVNWHDPVEYGWFQYLGGIQGIGGKPDAWITCFPSGVFEPEALAAARDDKFMGASKKPVFEAGWYEAKATGLSEDVKSFLDKHDPKSVVYVSFGTVVDGGENIIALFDYLAESKTPFIYAYGYQKELLPGHIVEILDEAEKTGRGLAPNWVDQLGVLAHPSTMCFISHCGANSIVESILAGVPILGWGGRFDQIQLASQVGNLKVGIELVQHRLGFGVGKSPASRPGQLIEGTPAALKAEIKAALDTINGPAGDEYRQTAKKMGDAIRSKRTEWDGQVDQFIAWAKA